MRQATERNQPFLLHVSLPRPHQCTSPSPEFWDLYNEKDLVLPPNADYEMAGKAPHLQRAAQRWRTGNWTLFEPKTFEAGRLRKMHGYLGAVSQVDHAVGLMLDCVQELGISEDTVVIYSADHGDYACEHGIMEKAPGICSDAITRIPHIWWGGERFRAGQVVDEIVETVDVSNTFCGLAGLDPLETCDGRDISHLLRGEIDRAPVHRVGVTELVWSKSVRKGNFRYVHYPPEMFAGHYPDGFGELYDLDADPWEMQNLCFDPNYLTVVQEMRDELLNWLITTSRPTTVHGANNTLTPQGPQTVIRYKSLVNLDNKIHPDRVRAAGTKHYL
jgi:choline-sulfatase/uncharacterized sulfatase